MASKYPSLFQPMKLGTLTLKNRIVKSGQWFLYAEPDGSCGDRIIAWYEGLAKHGPGMITIEESVCEFPGARARCRTCGWMTTSSSRA